MKIIYLAAGKAQLEDPNVVYNDALIKRDLTCDMLDVDLSPYDLLIATPPCNYWSRANYRRETSEYSQQTKHLLPNILEKFIKSGKPFIVENVINKHRMGNIVSDFPYLYIEHGRHCYFTNILGADKIITQVPQIEDNITNISKLKRQGGQNVNNVFNAIIRYIKQYGVIIEE